MAERRPQSARSPREARDPIAARPQSARIAHSKTDQPEWGMVSRVGRNFGEPPAPLINFLQPKLLPAALQGTSPKIRDVAHFRVEDCVQLKDGMLETNVPHQQPRPRSANVVSVALADLNSKPLQVSTVQREAVYLVRCDSTDTTYAVGH